MDILCYNKIVFRQSLYEALRLKVIYKMWWKYDRAKMDYRSTSGRV